jgi:hypothetical protein
MVDSGVPSRGRRVNIFRTDSVNAGVDFGAHATYGAVSCTNFSGGYTLTSAQACATPACGVTSPAASFVQWAADRPETLAVQQLEEQLLVMG